MKLLLSRRDVACVLSLALWSLTVPDTGAQSGVLTVRVGTAPPPPIALVNQGDIWHYRKGTNAPPVDWISAADGDLDVTWNTGPGGIGVGDGDDATVLTDMVQNLPATPGYLSVYTRKSFEIATAVDTNLQLRLAMDWDDGFVAYLDGVEIARSANVPGTPGTPHPFDLGVSPDHPAVVDGGQVQVFDLGAVGDRLSVGTHVLAIQGINGDVASSDLTLLANLALQDLGGGSAQAGGLFTLLTTPFVELAGTNTIADSARVTVNGEEAAYNIVAGTWSRMQQLSPGMNRIYVTALDAQGRVLSSVGRDVIYEASTTAVGGAVVADATWDPSMGVLRATSDVTVADGVTLTINPGTVILLSPSASMRAWTNGVILADGTEDRPVFFLPADGTTAWRELSALGVGATLTLRHADVAAGQVRILAAGTITVEDSVLREMYVRQMIEGSNGQQLIFRRSHLHDYAQAHVDFTPTLIEDCLIENITSDAMDFEGAPAEIIVRRTTWRYGFGSNTDAIDLGNNFGLRVESCLIHDFPDKGISIAVESHATTVENCLIYNTGSAINIYDSVDAVFNHNTVVNSGFGFRLYMRNTSDVPGEAVGTNNISWGNAASVQVTNGSSFEVVHSLLDFPGGYPGTGNLNADPLFLNPSLGDFRLGPGSPAAGAGLGGVDMGVQWPVGGMPSIPFDLGATPLSDASIELTWKEDADNEEGFLVERSADGLAWTVIGSTAANATGYTDSSLTPLQTVHYRVRSTNDVAQSRPSNRAIATTQASPASETVVGGPLPGSTTWDPSMGTIIVMSNVTLPSGAVLTIAAGTVVTLTNNTAITTTGGTINVLGTEDNKVIFREAGTADWAEITVSGAGASLTIRHADIAGGRVRCLSGASALLEDSHIHDSQAASVLNSSDAVSFTMRRCHVENYGETLFQRTLMLVEECLFENPSSDGIDFDGPPAGSTIRQCTFRFGPTGSNTDAVDLGPSAPTPVPVSVLVDSCIMHGFSDKGVSIGEIETPYSAGIVIRNCLMYDVVRGVQVKDTTIATIYGCTIVDSQIGIHGFEKSAGRPGGGVITNYNNILFGNVDAVVVEAPPNPTILTMTYTDTGGATWPGIGNINADPLFVNAADRDYRLAPGSPCIGTGLGGEDMGVRYPIGGVPAHPTTLEASPGLTDEVNLSWDDNSGNEAGFLVQISTDNLAWSNTASAPKNATAASVTGLLSGQTYFFRVRSTNFLGHSLVSNLASLGGDPNDLDGDGMPNDWETAHGLNPNDPSDASMDLDGDGMSNLEEFLAGTDPTDPDSKLAFESITLEGSNLVRLRFEALANRTYSVWFKDTLDGGEWEELTRVPSDTVDRIFTVDDSLLPIFTKRFYRIQTP